uniref:RRM domain-containing protein n=1 Tax=Haemonchus contortus TaxID=6289 RepID=A0A7I4YLI7_HAECO
MADAYDYSKHTDLQWKSSWTTSKTLANKVFVGRLTEKITEETLRDFFNKEAKEVKEAASVAYVHIPRPIPWLCVRYVHTRGGRLMKWSKSTILWIDGLSVVVTYAVPRESHQAGANVPPGYSNDFGSAYGYGKDGAAYDEAPLGLIPFASTVSCSE